MLLSDKIKELIADGKTQKAIEVLQDFLKGRDNALLNQCFLLKNQFTDLSRQKEQGLLDSGSELNRVNLALLNLCDEAQKLDPEADFDSEITENTEGGVSDKSVNTTLILMGVFIFIALIVVFLAIKYL
jgi:Effector-associated domain 11